MVGVYNEYGIHAFDRQVRIIWIAMQNRDVTVILQDLPEPQKDQREPANVLCQDPTALTNSRGKFEREVSRAASQVDNDISGLRVKRLDNIGWALPQVAFSFHSV